VLAREVQELGRPGRIQSHRRCAYVEQMVIDRRGISHIAARAATARMPMQFGRHTDAVFEQFGDDERSGGGADDGDLRTSGCSLKAR